MLQFYCEQIPGDATLHSLFKIDSEPVKCPAPLKGMNMFLIFFNSLYLVTSCEHFSFPLWELCQRLVLLLHLLENKNCRDMSEKREEQQKINQFSINRTKNFIGGTH